MPFTVNDLEGAPVNRRSYREELHEGRIVCPDCGWPMEFKREAPSVPRVAHFAHKRPPKGKQNPRKCAWTGMTEMHHNALRTLQDEPPQVFNALAGVYGRDEVRIANGKRRADVFFGGTDPLKPGDERRYPVAFEAQFSGIQWCEIEERSRDYHAAGVHVVWCFFEGRRGAREHFDACLRVHGCAGWMSADGAHVEFSGADALWLDLHPIDAHDRRTAYRQKQKAERRAIAEAERAAILARHAEQERAAAEARARMELRIQQEHDEAARQQRTAALARWEALQRQFQDALERSRLEYERQVEARRQAEIEAIERSRALVAARIAKANRDIGIDPERDAFTVEPVDVPASQVLGTPRRTLYRVFFRGMPAGWSYPARVAEEMAKLNALHQERKRGAA